MTKVQLPFELEKPLDDELMKSLSDLYGTYGILRIESEPGGQSLRVEFDATRFSPNEVEAALARAGLPLAQRSV